MTSKFPEVDPVSIAPLNAKGAPDLYNYMPTRMVPKEEAKERGWNLYFQGDICKYGHIAPRYVSNFRVCVDCRRLTEGKQKIGSMAAGRAEFRFPKHTEKKEKPQAPQEGKEPTVPDAREKRFLEAYANYKDIDKAAKSVALTSAQVHARMSWSKVFSKAVNELETRLNINTTIIPDRDFLWENWKYERLVEVYVDTGDLATARDSILVTPSEFYREIERNAVFKNSVEEAAPLAARALEERAIQMALAGNDKLLTKILSAKMPEYRERVNVDMNVTEKLDDKQLDQRLQRLFIKFKDKIGGYIDADFVDIKQTRKIAAPKDVGANGQTGDSQ